ncbi:MAG: hypothetical protein ABMA64_22185, partial [Myxococcota bacterium]
SPRLPPQPVDLGVSAVDPAERLGESARPTWAPPAAPLVLLDPPPRAPISVEPWVGGGPALRVRPELRTTAAAGAWGGIAIAHRLRLGAGLEGALPAGLVAWEGAYRLAMVDARALAAWSPGPWELGVTGGASVRAIVETPPAQVSPVAGAVLARRFPIGADAVRLSLLVEADLDRTGFDDPRDELGPTLLPPISAELALGWWSN